MRIYSKELLELLLLLRQAAKLPKASPLAKHISCHATHKCRLAGSQLVLP
jgi:hypothetical protein